MTKRDEFVEVRFVLTKAEKEKLDKLADWRTKQSKGRKNYTPEMCIRGFIQSCITGPSGWEAPEVTAQKYEQEKRAKAAATKASDSADARGSEPPSKVL